MLLVCRAPRLAVGGSGPWPVGRETHDGPGVPATPTAPRPRAAGTTHKPRAGHYICWVGWMSISSTICPTDGGRRSKADGGDFDLVLMDRYMPSWMVPGPVAKDPRCRRKKAHIPDHRHQRRPAGKRSRRHAGGRFTPTALGKPFSLADSLSWAALADAGPEPRAGPSPGSRSDAEAAASPPAAGAFPPVPPWCPRQARTHRQVLASLPSLRSLTMTMTTTTTRTRPQPTLPSV